jgi:hypothetical protein
MDGSPVYEYKVVTVACTPVDAPANHVRVAPPATLGPELSKLGWDGWDLIRVVPVVPTPAVGSLSVGDPVLVHYFKRRTRH